MGWPRLMTFNFGFQFVVLPDRVVQFFEWSHTWRDIWTDGRKLPADPPIPRYLGYAAGRWEGDTFVVESNGYDDRSWLAQTPVQRYGTGRPGGYPHTDEMRIAWRAKRVTCGALEGTLTIADTKLSTTPSAPPALIALYPSTLHPH